jgi:predicted NAD-dependent protein-ADP-ribosyltransferase YbiA (DUF1768 family)
MKKAMQKVSKKAATRAMRPAGMKVEVLVKAISKVKQMATKKDVREAKQPDNSKAMIRGEQKEEPREWQRVVRPVTKLATREDWKSVVSLDKKMAMPRVWKKAAAKHGSGTRTDSTWGSTKPCSWSHQTLNQNFPGVQTRSLRTGGAELWRGSRRSTNCKKRL